jgi:hypothetical protein
MRYGSGSWGSVRDFEGSDFHEKAFRRRDLPAWDARWHKLTPQARSHFLSSAKFPSRDWTGRPAPPRVPPDQLPPGELKELVEAGFVVAEAAQSRGSSYRAVIRDEASNFATRVRMLRQRHLLDENRPSELSKYVDQVFSGFEFTQAMSSVLNTAQIGDYDRLDGILQRYATNFRWPAWVARTLKDPLADRVLQVLHEAGGSIPLAELPGRVGGSDPAAVRAAVDRLIAYLALVEDLQPGTFEIMVGFLPTVREGLLRASRPRVRPPLVVCEHPREVGPEESAIVNDLRDFLLEVASEPPRIRQDAGLFQKEIDRFKANLEPLPSWLTGLLKWSDEGRLGQALAWARTLRLAEDFAEGKQVRLRLASKGHQWLSSGLDAQYASIYGLLNALPTRDTNYSQHWKLFHSGPDSYSGGIQDDTRFLGANVAALPKEKVKGSAKYQSSYYWNLKSEDFQLLRASLDRSLATLEPGVFYRLDKIAPHLVFGEHNPVNLGLAPDQVMVSQDSRIVPPLEEERDAVGRALLDAFIHWRLILLGCVRTAIDAEGKICIARERRLDAYFGREIPTTEMAPAVDSAARVVVQPDFSVIVIGINPTAAAELAPFCERAKGGSSQGALILKITRESVIKAVGHGLAPAQIVERLQRHASHEVPANVLHEVRDWSNWVRRVAPATITVIRCPDRDTADRVMGALKRQAERLNDTVVSIGLVKLTAAERNKLRAQGIIVESDPFDSVPESW